MSDLVAFLRARYDHAEEWARAQIVMNDERLGPQWHTGFDPDEALQVDRDGWLHVDPHLILRVVEAHRAILDRHTPHDTAFDGLACDWCSEDVDDGHAATFAPSPPSSRITRTTRRRGSPSRVSSPTPPTPPSRRTRTRPGAHRQARQTHRSRWKTPNGAGSSLVGEW